MRARRDRLVGRGPTRRDLLERAEVAELEVERLRELIERILECDLEQPVRDFVGEVLAERRAAA